MLWQISNISVIIRGLHNPDSYSFYHHLIKISILTDGEALRDKEESSRGIQMGGDRKYGYQHNLELLLIDMEINGMNIHHQ